MIDLILGPPGTGKTTELVRQVKERQPESLAFVAFTRKAALEAQARGTQGAGYEYRTLHSLCFKLVNARRDAMMDWGDYKELGRALNIKFSKFFDAEEAATGALAEGDKLRALVDYALATQQPIEAALGNGAWDLDEWRVKRYVQAVQGYKQDTGKLDFHDLLVQALKVPPLKLDMAVIDEAQDLSRMQWQVAQHLFSRAKHFVCAGDDDQAIFRWAGADVQTFQSLDEATRKVLWQSYRCPVAVAEVGSHITRRIASRYDKPWHPRAEGGEVNTVGSPEDVDLTRAGTHLLLCRNGYQLKQWAAHCRAKGVPYTVKGVRAVDAEHLAAIRNWERRRRAEAHNADKALHYASPHAQDDEPWYTALTALPPDDVAFYRAALARGADLDAVPKVNVSTIHGAKGGEADHVALLTDVSHRTARAAELSPDDEHRVWYVAVTRARQTLTIVHPQTPEAYQL